MKLQKLAAGARAFSLSLFRKGTGIEVVGALIDEKMSWDLRAK